MEAMIKIFEGLEEEYVQLLGMLILIIFYSIYFGKILLQKRKGIQTVQMTKSKIKDKRYYIERIMKLATYTVVGVEVISICVVRPSLHYGIVVCGVVLGLVGNVIFLIAVMTMKDSWRVGIAVEEKTKMVTTGIYKISRNPAFLGFDCVYIGLVLMFFNIPLLLFSAFAMIMLHLQILQEEQFLPTLFGEDYISYKKKVSRYIGRKR